MVRQFHAGLAGASRDGSILSGLPTPGTATVLPAVTFVAGQSQPSVVSACGPGCGRMEVIPS